MSRALSIIGITLNRKIRFVSLGTKCLYECCSGTVRSAFVCVCVFRLVLCMGACECMRFIFLFLIFLNFILTHEKGIPTWIKYANMHTIPHTHFKHLTGQNKYGFQSSHIAVNWRIVLNHMEYHYNLQFIRFSCECSCFRLCFLHFSQTQSKCRKKNYIARGKYYDRRHIHAIVTQWIRVHLFDIHYGNVNGDVRVVAQQTLDLVNFSLRHKLLFC